MFQLKKVTYDNLWEVVELSVKPNQEYFIASNTDSLFEAYLALSEGHSALPFGLYKNERLIGFVMFGYGSTGDEGEPLIAEGNYCMWRFMIDQNFQGKGYGKEALKACLQYLKRTPMEKAEYCWLSYNPDNTIAKSLYESVGFEANGETLDGEVVLVLSLTNKAL